ncbi:MAG: helix-turn-helix domain-containing protein [Gemmatimonadaceae bacterium]
MTTLLSKPLSREVLLDGLPFKVVISPTGVRLSRKGTRKATEVGWDNVLALGESVPRRMHKAVEGPPSDLPEAVAADAAKQIRAARDALTRASEALSRAGDLPASVLTTLDPDPVYGRVEHHSDWFIEPLLTADELASILRMSRRTVATLSVPSLLIGGERRYRQSEVRRFLAEQETTRFSSLRSR